MYKRVICAIICLSFLFIGLNPAMAISRQDLLDEEKYYQGELERVQFTCISYMLDNLLPTAAVLAAGGALSAQLDDHLNADTKEALAAMGILGVIYCMDKFSECAAVGTKITAYITQIEGIERKLGHVRRQIASLN